MTHVSIIPSDFISHSIHLRYELLPPHPPFVTSISLKLKNVILLNSGDMLFAILLDKYFDNSKMKLDDVNEENENTDNTSNNCFCYCELKKSKLKRSNDESEPSSQETDSSEKETNESEKKNTSSQTDSIDSIPNSCSSDEMLNDNIFPIPKTKSSKMCKSPNYIHSTAKITSPGGGESKTNIVSDVNFQSPEKSDDHSPSCILSSGDSLKEDSNPDISDVCNKNYVSYVLQGFSLPSDEESPESLPASPFDCTTQVLPCHLSTLDGSEEVKHTYEHRCFRKADKGKYFDFFISSIIVDLKSSDIPSFRIISFKLSIVIMRYWMGDMYGGRE